MDLIGLCPFMSKYIVMKLTEGGYVWENILSATLGVALHYKRGNNPYDMLQGHCDPYIVFLLYPLVSYNTDGATLCYYPIAPFKTQPQWSIYKNTTQCITPLCDILNVD